MKGWSGTLEAAVASASSAATAAQATAEQALDDASIVWAEIVFALTSLGSVTPATLNIVAPVTGTFHTLSISSTGTPSVDVSVAATIGGVAVTGGSVAQQPADAPGVVRSSTTTAANAVTALTTSVLLTFTSTGNTTTMRSTVMVGFRRS
jgi:hypothetical protein